MQFEVRQSSMFFFNRFDEIDYSVRNVSEGLDTAALMER